MLPDVLHTRRVSHLTRAKRTCGLLVIVHLDGKMGGGGAITDTNKGGKMTMHVRSQEFVESGKPFCSLGKRNVSICVCSLFSKLPVASVRLCRHFSYCARVS